MESLSLQFSKTIFTEYTLSNEEMISIRGGEGEPTPVVTPPPVKI
ncbi:MAG: hypothetical protein ABFD02_16205 [Bacteroidales bacterium]